MIEFSKKLEMALDRHGAAVMATMVSHRGSAPQVDGAKAIITESGLFWGTIGGGKIENEVIQKALSLLTSSLSTEFLSWNLQTDIGMTCGGEVKIFLEKFGKPKLKVAVFGAGHVSQALIPMLLKLDCSITCLDSRQEWLDKLPDSFKLKKLCPEVLSSAVKDLAVGTFLISMTQGHKHDVPILKEAFYRGEELPYIGVIGSEQKARVIKSELVEAGVDLRDLERLFCPLGLNFGSNIPEEIAFSIIAQIITERDLIS